ncbi:MAG: type II toxin-antitoxin system RelB/DinJ family antitoxin [Candidatus Pacebacteria bacterium]|jgi:addiction module RelB/DinJ family antitoxin|nr:type II toxin-antitoxin system RelB/DinJ family antitoxin [Candidatus Paceibacterota bacterium]
MEAIINFKTDKKIKAEAQDIAKRMGLSLSDVLNVLLRGFVRDKELNVNLEEPSKWLLKELAEADADIKAGRVSPMFSDAEEAIKWLDNKDRKYENRV